MFADPGGREPAPMPLRTVQAFVNTLDIENRREELASPSQLAAVLHRVGVLDDDRVAFGPADVRAALRLREALRDVLLENNGGGPRGPSWVVLERVARDARLTIEFSRADPRLVPRAGALDGALGRIVAIVFTSMTDGSWPRLKACRRDICHWVYYDKSRNRSSTWCAMEVCGNRTKVVRYRGRNATRSRAASAGR